MKQQTFEAERSERWQRFEQLLEILDRGAHDTTGEFPSLFRQLCQDLSLARDRMFTEDLVTRLNRLALKGHEHLYASRVPPRSAVLEFAARGFPRAVRQEGPLVLALSGLFFGSLGLCAAAVVTWPELAPSFLGSDSLTQLREMYGEDLARRPSDDLQMFGFYIWNNVSIAFRMFAGGLLVGIGSLIALLFNGIYIGLVTGYVIHQDLGAQFFPFVVGHGSFELTAIVLAAAAGMRMGLSILAPGRFSRRAALQRAAQTALPVVYGTGAMLVIAAVIEAFWSPSETSPVIRYGVGALLWTLVLGYLCFAGRSRAA